MGKFEKMSMQQLTEQYQEQLNIVKRQIKEMEQSGTDNIDYRKYRQLKQIKSELQTTIRQMKRYKRKDD